MTTSALLSSASNQAAGIAAFAKNFLKGFGTPSEAVLKRVVLFHTDAVVCGLSALSARTRAPTLLRDEALSYVVPHGSKVGE